MKILLDMVLNHTSDEHSWFKESSSSRDNPKADWYIWRDKPNNWKNIIGTKGWHYCKTRDQYYFASFLSFQPDLNYQHPEVKKQMWDVCRFWLDKGADGFRLDIFNCIIKDKEFKNNPFSLLHILPSEEHPGGNFQIRKYSLNQPENFELARELRAVVNTYSPQRILLGEVFGGLEKITHYLGNNQDGLHLIFSFDILYFKFNAKFFREKLNLYEAYFPVPKTPVVVFSNHDQLRSQARLNNSLEKAKLLTVLQFTIRAIPVVYYGEEIGMTNSSLPIKTAKDALAKEYSWVPQFIVNRMPVPLNRDNCRTPMQWNAEKNAGFSTATDTWLPIKSDFMERNVADFQQDKNSLWYVYQELLQLRKNSPTLQMGEMNIATSGGKSVLKYVRKLDQEKILICMNFSYDQQKIVEPTVNYTLLYGVGEFEIKPDAWILGKYVALILKEN